MLTKSCTGQQICCHRRLQRARGRRRPPRPSRRLRAHPVWSASARHWSDTHQRQRVGPVSRRTDIWTAVVSKVAVQSVCFSDHHLLTCYWSAMHCRSQSRRHTPTGRCARLTRQPSTPTFYSPSCLASLSSTLTAMPICSTRRSNESWTSMRHYGQVVVAVASTTAATYRMRLVKPSSSVGVLNVGTDEPAYQTRKLISQHVQLHVRASSSHRPITSTQNSTKRPVIFTPPGERHRDCCTADTRSSGRRPGAQL